MVDLVDMSIYRSPMARRSTTTAARRLTPREKPIRDFLGSIETLRRDIRRLPAKQLAQRVFASEKSAAYAKVRRQLDGLARDVEEVRRNVESDEAGQLAKHAQQSADRQLGALLRKGELLEPAELAVRLHWTRQALSKALAAGRVFFVELHGTRYYPAFFADPRYERRQIEAVSKALGDLPGGAKLAFMTTPKASLAGHTPLEALAGGELRAARAAAAAARVR